MDKAKEIGWNSVAPVADSNGSVIPGTLIKSGQEVIYSKILRKMAGHDRKSWMELVMFSLVTSATDPGFGSWYGKYTPAKSMGFMDVLKEAVRPFLSVAFVEYMFQVSYQGFHNPMRTFYLKDFLIALAAKDLSEGGNALLAQNVTQAESKIAVWEQFRGRQQIAGRFQVAPKPSS